MKTVTPLTVNDRRAKGLELVKTVEDIFGITEDWVAVKDTTYWVRRSPGELIYTCYQEPGWGPAGHIVIGRREDGRIVMQPQNSRCEPLSGERVTEFSRALRLVHLDIQRHTTTVNT